MYRVPISFRLAETTFRMFFNIVIIIAFCLIWLTYNSVLIFLQKNYKYEGYPISNDKLISKQGLFYNILFLCFPSTIILTLTDHHINFLTCCFISSNKLTNNFVHEELNWILYSYISKTIKNRTNDKELMNNKDNVIKLPLQKLHSNLNSNNTNTKWIRRTYIYT